MCCRTPRRTPAKSAAASAAAGGVTVPVPFTFESDKRIKSVAGAEGTTTGTHATTTAAAAHSSLGPFCATFGLCCTHVFGACFVLCLCVCVVPCCAVLCCVVLHPTEAKPFIPMAAGVENFLKSARQHEPISSSSSSSSSSAPTLTQPQPFHLHTADRAAAHPPQPLLSTAERELKELEAVQPFRAAPINPKVMNSAGELGVPRIKKAPPTVPKVCGLVWCGVLRCDVMCFAEKHECCVVC